MMNDIVIKSREFDGGNLQLLKTQNGYTVRWFGQFYDFETIKEASLYYINFGK